MPSLMKWKVVPPGAPGCPLGASDDEDRGVEGCLLGPEAFAAVEHPLPEDAGAGAFGDSPRHVVVGAGLAALAEVEVLAEVALRKIPALQRRPLAPPVLVGRVIGV